MTELNFKGKEFVYNHHLAVPFRPLVPHPEKGIGPVALDGNLIIQGDNLHALKALLPLYAGKVDCICIDPPYNTGNEGWCYNDNVNSPMIKEWFDANPVGIEDGLRHDKWCAMMWPRLRLLHELLATHGAIIVFIDDNELDNLREMLSEIFGRDNHIATLCWEKGKKGDSRFFSINHEYVVVFVKDKAYLESSKTTWRRPKKGADEVLARYAELRKSNGDDHQKIRTEMMKWFRELPDNDPRKSHKHYNWSDDRGLYFPDNFAGPDDGRKDRPRYNIVHPNGKVTAKPATGWRWDEETTKKALAQTPPRIHFGPDEKTIPNRKSYLSEIDTEPFPSVFYKDGRSATKNLELILKETVFSFPKDIDIVGQLIQTVSTPTAIILDSFAGSAATAHAVLEANKRDRGSRRFILVEMEEYADRLTAERVRRVINGYEFEGTQKIELLRESLNWRVLTKAADLVHRVEGIENLEGKSFDRIKKEVKDGELIVSGETTIAERAEGLGGAFTYCTLGPPVELDKVLSGETLPSYATIGAALFHMATNRALDQAMVSERDFYLGETESQHVWLVYRPDLDWLKTPDAALTLSRAKAFAAAKPGKRHFVFAPARFVSQKMLAEQNIPVEFVPLPFALYRIDRS